jgi:hypothetical protein
MFRKPPVIGIQGRPFSLAASASTWLADVVSRLSPNGGRQVRHCPDRHVVPPVLNLRHVVLPDACACGHIVLRRFRFVPCLPEIITEAEPQLLRFAVG